MSALAVVLLGLAGFAVVIIVIFLLTRLTDRLAGSRP